MRTNVPGWSLWPLVAPFFSVVVLAVGADLRLLDAVKGQDKERAGTLLKQRVDVNVAFDGATALHWAVHWDDLETVDLLIRAGADVNAANGFGVTSLYLACSNGNGSMVERLLAGGANPNIAKSTGESPLMACARTGDIAGVRALIAHKANVNAVESSQQQTALMWAVAERHPEVARVLLENGANIRARTSVYTQTVFTGEPILPAPRDGAMIAKVQRGGSTPLLFAARNGDVESARILLAAGADVNDTAADGNSALVIAAHSGHGKLAAFLLDKDANPDSAGAGYTALHAAVLRGDLDLVNTLLAHGASPNLPITKGTPVTREGMDYVLPTLLVGATPFLLAAKFVEIDVMRALAAHGADVNLPLKDKSTPLMMAAGIGWDAGADRRGVPIFGAAAPEDERMAFEATKYLLDLGADVNATNAAGNTAMHGAASKGFNSVIQLLADKGAGVDVGNKREQTPVALALSDSIAGNSHGLPVLKSTVDLLLKLGAKDPRLSPPPARTR